MVERDYDFLPVRDVERDSALARLEWIRKQGGAIDPSRIPSRKPAFAAFTVDDRGYLWVRPTLADSVAALHTFDVFDSLGRYLGPVEVPFTWQSGPLIVRGDHLWAATRDSLDVPYVVVARIRGR